MNQSGSYSVTKKSGAENQLLLNESSKNGIPVAPKSIKHGGEFHNGSSDRLEKTTLLDQSQPVKLNPSWEQDPNLSDDDLNFKNMSLDEAKLSMNPPTDRLNIVFFILMLHGIGCLMPWNMFVNASSYFTDYKLSKDYTGQNVTERAYFSNSLALASQAPNLLFNWVNIFIQFGGNLTTRVVWSIFVEVVIFVLTVVLAMADTSANPTAFFWITIFSVIILNVASGIYQNTVYGMGARLPPSYTGAVILGSNISGTLTAFLNLLTMYLSPGQRTSAIYYFITALFVLLLCFDTYFALPLIRFYRYNEYMSARKDKKSGRKEKIPYGAILWSASPQLLNVFMTFFVTLSIFPSVHEHIKSIDDEFIINKEYYKSVMCFLTFNTTAMLGSFVAGWIQIPGRRYLWVLVWLRLAFIPFFLLLNYQPLDMVRTMPVYITNDWVYFTGAILHGLTSGYCSSLAMMFVPGTVDPQYATTAGMFGGASLVTGIVVGIVFSLVFPPLVTASFW